MLLKPFVSAVLMAVAALVPLSVRAQAPTAARSERPGPRGIAGRLTWFDRRGKIVGTVGETGIYRTLALSPDGKRVAVERTDPATQNKDIWVFDVATNTGIRLTSDPAWDAFPIWSPDGARIVFMSNRSGVYDLYEKAASGAGTDKLFYRSTEGKGVTSWSPDGKFLLYYSIGQPTHVRLLAADGPADREAVPLVDPRFASVSARFSPDGRWIAYSSNESGKNEISIRTFESATGTAGAPVIATKGGGRGPLWRGDGKELFYIAADGTAMAMKFKSTGSTFQVGAPKPLFKIPAGLLFWDVSPDGKRFLMPAPEH